MDCYICGRSAEGHQAKTDIRTIRCKHCGLYEITGTAAALVLNGSKELKPYLSAHTRQASERKLPARITSDNWRELAEEHRHTSVPRKIAMVLQHIASRWPTPGCQFDLREVPEDFPLFDAVDRREAGYYVDALVRQGAVQQATASHSGIVTPEGWGRLDPNGSGGELGTCFVAMAFDPGLDEAYQLGFTVAIRAAGLQGGRVDRIQYNGKIDDRVLAEIRRSQVTIADVTLQRNGVYFEAGFALGLGRIVVWTCREDDKDNIHFDTRQYNHIFWTSPGDRAEQLEARLRGTVQIPVKN